MRDVGPELLGDLEVSIAAVDVASLEFGDAAVRKRFGACVVSQFRIGQNGFEVGKAFAIFVHLQINVPPGAQTIRAAIGILARLILARQAVVAVGQGLYFWCLFGAAATMTALAITRWSEDYPLFILGALSFGSAWLGRTILRRRWWQWPRLHLTLMAASYVLMITAFYVDNGKNLPVWRYLPQIAFWVLPILVAAPLVLGALRRHPVVVAYDAGRRRQSAN